LGLKFLGDKKSLFRLSRKNFSFRWRPSHSATAERSPKGASLAAKKTQIFTAKDKVF
jgi:hypothetical protein